MPKTPTILAATALAVAALGATPLGHAAGKLILPTNSVGSKQLQKSAVTGLKVKDGTLTAADFAGGQLQAGPQGPKGDAGATGATGAQGLKGDTGATGASGLSGYEVVMGAMAHVTGSVGTASADCPAGKKAVGGGFSTVGGTVIAQGAKADGSGWIVAANPGGQTVTLVAQALCAYVG
jgi:hypothetical protein